MRNAFFAYDFALKIPVKFFKCNVTCRRKTYPIYFICRNIFIAGNDFSLISMRKGAISY